jgi:hypothetical protein
MLVIVGRRGVGVGVGAGSAVPMERSRIWCLYSLLFTIGWGAVVAKYM